MAVQRYVKLDGSTLDLALLNEGERRFLRVCYEAYRAGAALADLRRLAESRKNPLVWAARAMGPREVEAHPLAEALRDLEDRAGLREGAVAPRAGLHPERDPLEPAPAT